MAINDNYLPASAITPIDGRNRHKVKPLAQYFSELALDKYRVFVEIKYLLFLSKKKVVRRFTNKEVSILEKVWGDFSIKDIIRIREIEKTTNHDLKAVEYWIKEKVEKTSLFDLLEMIHFGLASDDVNNLAYSLSLKDALNNVIFPNLRELLTIILVMAKETKSIPILARTHGQVASVTTIGKEIFVFGHRLVEEFSNLKSTKLNGKINGDVGNWHSHSFVFPKVKWIDLSAGFVDSLGLSPQLVSTQIEPYDSWIHIFESLYNINAILIGFCRDLWLYAALGLLKLKTIEKEVGSSLMPHKVNPIYLEGAEGGLELANALFMFFIQKFSTNRLQRDFSDSTVRRNIGFALAHALLGYQSINEALNRLSPNQKKIEAEIEEHYEVLAEAIQSFLRFRGLKKPYELLKNFTRGQTINKTEMRKFIKGLPLDKIDKDKLLKLSPILYTGLAENIVNKYLPKDERAIRK